MSKPRRGTMSFSDAAYNILKSAKAPMTPTQIAQQAVEMRLVVTNSVRPDATMASRMRNDERFVRVGDGNWKLKD
jgi:DNA-directed RNA polymerase delta subunit